MKKLILLAALFACTGAYAKEVTVKEVSNDGKFYFLPSYLTIQPGDTVHFVNEQDNIHEVMFVSVPKGVNEMIMSPLQEKKGDTFSHTFTIPGTYQFHCHPHEALGMQGTLIVGKPSKKGETKHVDHHALEKQLEAKSH